MTNKNLYFKHANGERTLVQPLCPKEEVMREIYRYVSELNPSYTIYYVRSWGDDATGYTYDVGSHTEFFYWED